MNSPIRSTALFTSYQLMVLENEKKASANTTPILIHTDDCLQGYHAFLSMGILPYTKPQYTDKGLAFGLYDPSGNAYTVIEERDYREI